MGQRTQILLQVKNRQGDTHTTMHYCQWGIGKVMPFTFIKMLMEDYLSDKIHKDYDPFKAIKVENGSMSDISNMFNKPIHESVYKEVDAMGNDNTYDGVNGYENECVGYKSILKDIDIFNVENLRKVFEECDNNNGGMVIYAEEKEERYHRWVDFSIGFLFGSEETSYYDKDDNYVETEKPFSRYVPYEEWVEKVGGRYMKEGNMDKIFKQILDFFDVTIL